MRKQHLGSQHKKLDKAKLSDSAKRFSYLLGLTDLFKHFIGQNEEFKQAMEEAERQNKTKKGAKAKGEARRRRTEQEEDAELLEDEEETESATVFRESPSCKSIRI